MTKLYIRENYLKNIRGFYHDVDMIKVISGVRRCGKSSLMEIMKDELTGRNRTLVYSFASKVHLLNLRKKY